MAPGRNLSKKNDFGGAGRRSFLVRGVLIGTVQRPVGKVGVHPSAPIDENTLRKQLKSKELELFQNGAVSALFETGSPRAEMGRDWANQ